MIESPRRLYSSALAAIAALLFCAASVSAATFTVTNLADAGPGSLRQAVLDANASAGADEVVFAAGLTGTITLTSGQIAITNPLVVSGPGIGALTISGNDQFRIFLIENPAVETLIDVTISGLTLTHGRGMPVLPSPAGGAVLAFRENLTIVDCKIIDSFSGVANDFSLAGCGGNVALLGCVNLLGQCDGFLEGTLRMVGTVLERGRVVGSGLQGGANLCVLGRLLMERSKVSGGSFVTDGFGAGGGLYLNSSASDNSIVLSEFSGNEAGGIDSESFSGSGVLTIESSTISGNFKDFAAGGGIVLFNSDLRLQNSTVSGNLAAQGAGIHGIDSHVEILNSTLSGNHALERGGGISFAEGGRSTLRLRLSTVANNSAGLAAGNLLVPTTLVTNAIELDHVIIAKGTPQDLSGAGANPAAISANYSLVETPAGFALQGSHNLVGVDPLLGPLVANGGPTLTHRPLSGSPVVDAGNPTIPDPPATDQRGASRLSGTAIDLGSVEAGASAEIPTLSELGLLALCSAILAGGIRRLRKRGPASA